MLQDTLHDTYQMVAQSFKRSLLAQNRSPRTIQSYREVVDLLGRFLAEKGMPRQPAGIRREHVEAFLADLLERTNPCTGRKGVRPARQPPIGFDRCRRYFEWLVDDEIKRSPMEKMKSPTVPEEPPPVITDDELRRLLHACEGRDFYARRDTAIIRLLLDTGMRRAVDRKPQGRGCRLDE